MELTFEVKRKNALWALLSYVVVFYGLVSILQIIIMSIVLSATNSMALYREAIFRMQAANPTDYIGWLINNGYERLIEPLNLASAYTNLAVYVVMIGLLLLIFRKEWKSEINLLVDKQENTISKVLLSLLAFYVANFIINIFINTVTVHLLRANMFGANFFIETTSVNQASIEAMLRGKSLLPMAIAAVLFGPIVEELIFRKAFFAVIKDEYLALLISSIAFGMIHVITSIESGFNWISLLISSTTYLTSGFLFGFIYIKNKKNIWVPIGVHMISNFLSILLLISMSNL